MTKSLQNSAITLLHLKVVTYSDTFCINCLVDFMDCFVNNTKSLADTITVALHDYLNIDNLYNPEYNLMLTRSYWQQTAANIYMGRCHTLQYPTEVGANFLKDGFIFGLNPNQQYDILIHDPNFYLLVTNPVVFPRFWIRFSVK